MIKQKNCLRKYVGAEQYIVKGTTATKTKAAFKIEVKERTR